MSHYVEPRPTEAAGTRSEQVSGWVGWIAFAGVIMVVLGSFHLMQGLVALLEDTYYLVRPSGLVVSADFTQWGWTHVIFGAVVVIAGLCVFAGQVWARVVGVILASLSAIVNVGFLGAYPLWSMLMIALDIVVIMALTVHGAEIKPARP
jgi:hypothetical protein